MDANQRNPSGLVSRPEYERVLTALQAAQRHIDELLLEIAELKKQRPAAASPAQVAEAYSMRSEAQRQQARGQKAPRQEAKKRRRGRRANEEKLRRATKTEAVYPEGVPPEQCQESHVRLVWRLGEDRQALLVAYRVFRKGKQYGRVAGVLGRSEFGLEIVLTLAQLVYGMHLSFDAACQVMGFLQNVQLSKSQADALLRQLARAWSDEFEVLCTLLANALVVHADETSWSIHSVWALLSEQARVLLYGVHKDEATLHTLLDPECFQGLLISDDAAVYGKFHQSQKCWAHLLRKAIKLTLQEPQHGWHRAFADGLLAIYHRAHRLKQDRRYRDAGRRRQVKALEAELFALCDPVWPEPWPPNTPGHDRCNLALEILRLLEREELFVFVTAPAVEQPNGVSQTVGGTNNEAERTLRSPARARQTGQTSKTASGARRTSILTSVLQSLRLYVPSYTLDSVLEEVQRWQATGKSCFRQWLEKLKLSLPEYSVLDRLYPEPSG